jgi:integrase
MLKETRGQTRFLEYDEEDRLVAASNEPLTTINLTEPYAGLRIQSEALTLKEPDVDFKNRILTVQVAHAKTNETRMVPIHSKLIDPLRR